MELVKIKAVAPFVGAFPTTGDHADYIKDALVDDGHGNLVKRRIPYRKVVGTVDVWRPATEADRQDDAERRRIAEMTGAEFHSRLSSDGQSVLLPADPAVILVSPAYAKELVAKGLAEVVGPDAGKLKRPKAA